MKLYIATLKYPKAKDHNPKLKRAGLCYTSEHCTDETGAHHSILIEANTQSEAEDIIHHWLGESIHITRIEVARTLRRHQDAKA